MERKKEKSFLFLLLLIVLIILWLYSKKKPKGLLYPINITVRSQTEIDFRSNPLFSITVYNDGPDEVYFSINQPQKTTPIKPHEHLKIEFQEPKIAKIFFEVNAGKVANIRGFGVY